MRQFVPVAVPLYTMQHKQERLGICMALAGASAKAELMAKGSTARGSAGGCCEEPHHTFGGWRRSSSSVCQCTAAQKRLSRAGHPAPNRPQPHQQVAVVSSENCSDMHKASGRHTPATETCSMMRHHAGLYHTCLA